MLISMERTTRNYAISVQWVFRLFLVLAFLSTCWKNRQSFANESLILKLLKFSFEGQLLLPASVKDAGNLVRSFARNWVYLYYWFW